MKRPYDSYHTVLNLLVVANLFVTGLLAGGGCLAVADGPGDGRYSGGAGPGADGQPDLPLQAVSPRRLKGTGGQNVGRVIDDGRDDREQMK
ncbi:hypothetical protein ABX035_005171, partial [Salmonella enterica]